jgi:hypothetical protein
VANTLDTFRNRAVGFIDWLGLWFRVISSVANRNLYRRQRVRNELPARERINRGFVQKRLSRGRVHDSPRNGAIWSNINYAYTCAFEMLPPSFGRNHGARCINRELPCGGYPRCLAILRKRRRGNCHENRRNDESAHRPNYNSTKQSFSIKGKHASFFYQGSRRREQAEMAASMGDLTGGTKLGEKTVERLTHSLPLARPPGLPVYV